MSDFALLRKRMVDRQIGGRGITDQLILAAFEAVPREKFVAAELAPYAYDDGPLPIEAAQTISQPYIVALMIEAAAVNPGERILEIGAGSGYAAAVMSRIAARVVAVERQPELVRVARDRLSRLGYDNVEIVEADGTMGWPPEAPYDAILVAASGSKVPEPLIDQLKPGGRLVMPVGARSGIQNLIKLSKREDGSLLRADLGAVRFVPLIGAEGYRAAEH